MICQDKLTTIEQHTQEGLDNLSRIQDFIRKRAQAEQRYAKELQGLAEGLRQVETTQVKKKKGEKVAGVSGQDSVSKAFEAAVVQADATAKVHTNLATLYETDLMVTIKNQMKVFEGERKKVSGTFF